MKIKLSELEPGQAFTFCKNTYVRLSANNWLNKDIGNVPCLRLTGGQGMGPAWQVASFSDDENLEVELYEGEE